LAGVRTRATARCPRRGLAGAALMVVTLVFAAGAPADAKLRPAPYGAPLRVPSSNPYYLAIVSENLPTVGYGQSVGGVRDRAPDLVPGRSAGRS
jgi:hypothetical protein